MRAANPPGVEHWFRTKLDECRRIPSEAYEGLPVVLVPNPTDISDVEVQLESGRRLGCLFPRAAYQVQDWLASGKAVRASIYILDYEMDDDGRRRPSVRVLLEFLSG